MAGKQRTALVIDRLRGRDGSTTAEFAIPHDRAKEMENVDLYRTTFARKRNGCENVFSATTSEAFTGAISALGRFVPGADNTAAQLWAVDNAATPVVQRITGGTVWSTPTLKDNWSGSAQHTVFVTFNSKLFIFYDSAVDRLHVWDGSTVRRVGLATPAAPTVADTGAGTYAAQIRYYKVAYLVTGGRWSDTSASVTFTPSGTGTAARITKPAAINEGETSWAIYVSADDRLYFLLTTLAVGTTTYDDSADPDDASGGDPIPLVGANTVPVSAKYGLVDGNRLLLAGSWESQNTSRVWFTPRLGSSDYADDERIPNTVDQENWVDVNEEDGDCITGVGGPIQGMPIIFKNRNIYKMRPTLSAVEPYQPMLVSNSVGCLRHHTIVMAEDEHGDPALYFLSHRGPYRLGLNGLQYLGREIEDIWIDRFNVDATTVKAFTIWHEDRHQVWFHLAVDDDNTPTLTCVFDVQQGEPDEDGNVLGGWTVFTETLADVRCGVMFSQTIAASMSEILKPYLGAASAVLLRADTGALDVTADFEGSVTLPEKHLAGLRHRCKVQQAIILGSAGPHTLRLETRRDYGLEARRDDVQMAAEDGDQLRAQRVFEAAFQADAKSIGMTVGDVCPTALLWEIDALLIQFETEQEIAS
jgi:hypothetical protein